MQLGLYEAFLAGTTRLYEALDFDLVLLSTEYVALGETREFPRRFCQLVAPASWPMT